MHAAPATLNLSVQSLSAARGSHTPPLTSYLCPQPCCSTQGSLRQPLGREYNPDTAFRNLTRPAVLKNNGVVIAPARFSEGVAQHAASGATVASNGVARIAGGMVQMAGPVDKEKAKGKGKGKGAGGGKGGGGKPGAKRVKT